MEDRSFVSQRASRSPAASPWTDERIDRLKARWSQGATARQISRELGHGISRSAVLGKVHRLRIDDATRQVTGREERIDAGRVLHLRETVAGSAPSRRPRVLPAWVLNAKRYIDDRGVDTDIPLSQRRPLLELNPGTCRWPVGEPGKPDFFFCGAEPLPNKPYCAAHCTRAYRQADATARA